MAVHCNRDAISREPTARCWFARHRIDEKIMPDTPVPLKNRYLAGLLAWMVPGLGHWYQGRRAKAVPVFRLPSSPCSSSG